MQQTKKASQNTKDLRQEVENLLLGSLNHLKELWGEKKFHNKIEDAAKLLTKGLKKEEKKPKEAITKKTATAVKTKTTEKKKAVKKEVAPSEDIASETISKPQKSAAKKVVKKNIPAGLK